MMTAKPQSLLRSIYNVLVGANKSLVEIANRQLVGINDDAIAQNEFSNSVQLSVSGSQVTGEIIKVVVIRSEDGTGAILKEPLDLYFFRSDPLISAGDDVFAVAHANASVGDIHIAAGDYAADLAGTDTAGMATKLAADAFKTDTSGRLWVVMVNRGTTTINSVVGDDEQVEMTILFRLDD